VFSTEKTIGKSRKETTKIVVKWENATKIKRKAGERSKGKMGQVGGATTLEKEDKKSVVKEDGGRREGEARFHRLLRS